MSRKPDEARPGIGVEPDFKQRRASRVVMGGNADLIPHKLYKFEVQVRNLSTSGFMAECAEPVLIGSCVLLDVPGIGPVHAQVRWQLGSRMGGMFLDPISLAQCRWTAVKEAEAA